MNNLFNKSKLYVKKSIFEYAKKDYLKRITHNIGKVVIEDDKIICYVDQKMLDKNRRKYGRYGRYNLMLFGTGENKNLKPVKVFGLDKKFNYVFDGINFDRVIELDCPSGNVVFENCVFNENIKIYCAGEVILQNNKYYYPSYSFNDGKCYLKGTMDKLLIMHDNFENSYDNRFRDSSNVLNFGIDVNVKKFSIVSSRVKSDDKGVFSIKADEIFAASSSIEVPEVYIDSKKISWGESNYIKASNGVIIENENNDFNGNIDSPVIIYNGLDISKAVNKEDNINIEASELIQSRQNVVNVLNNLKEYCLMLNNSVSVEDTINKGNVLVKK